MSRPSLLSLSPGRALWSLAWPAAALGLVRSGYHMAATFWAGRMEDSLSAQAALGAASFAVWILTSVADLAAVGTHAMVARAEGAGERGKVGAVVVQGAWVALLCGVATALGAGWLNERYFSAIGFGGQGFGAARAMGEGYMRAWLLGAALLNLHTMLGATFRGLGMAREAMQVSVLTLLLNAALDPFLMFGWWGLPALGLAGASWATVAASGAGVVAFAWLLVVRGVRPRWGMPTGAGAAQVARLGTPAMISGVGFCLVYVAMGDLLSSFGPSALAGLGLGHRLESPAYQVCSGFGAAGATLVGQHLGAGDRAGAAEAARRTARWACAVMAPVALLFLLTPGGLIGLLSRDAEAVARGTTYLFGVGVILLPMALELVYDGVLSGAGDTWVAMVIEVALTAARVPLSWWLVRYWGVEGVWAAIMGTCALKGFSLWGAFSLRSRRPGWGSGVRL